VSEEATGSREDAVRDNKMRCAWARWREEAPRRCDVTVQRRKDEASRKRVLTRACIPPSVNTC
jgi:hypothetical protein